MSNALFYANNADIKYPLSDFHTADIPNDLLMDLSLSVPAAIEPVLLSVQTGIGFVCLIIEDKTTKCSVASVLIENPLAAMVYPLTMDVEGYGWVVFGPGLHTPYNSGEAVVDFDSECVLRQSIASGAQITVNGQEYDLPGFLEIGATGALITVEVDGNTIVLERDDDAILRSQLPALSVDGQAQMALEGTLLYTLGGALPDENGNVDIDIEGCVEPCLPTRDLALPRGDTSIGEATELPLDIYNPRRYDPDDPCKPSESATSSSSAEHLPEGPFDGDCQYIGRNTLIDIRSNRAIGTLYTLQEYTESSSAGA